jgi:hypothetical protein
MALTRVDRERLNDSQFKLQSVAHSLKNVNPQNVPDLQEIEECLEAAERSLAGALRTPDANPAKRK